MSIITRYLLRQFVGPLFVCLVTFNGVFILFDLFGQLSRFIEADLPFDKVLLYYAGVICMYSHWFLPASCMLATLYSMWQLSHHNELTAMRASGISFHRLTFPFFFVALIVGILDWSTAEYLTPGLAAWSDKMKSSQFKAADHERTENLLFVTENRRWRFASVDTSDEAGFANAQTNVVITQEIDESQSSVISADSARYADGIWWLSNPTFTALTSNGDFIPENNAGIAGDKAGKKNVPSFFPFPEFTETPHDMLLANREWMYLGSTDMFRILRKTGGNNEKWVDFWYSLAAPWTCIVITLFAIPAGITGARQSIFRGIALTFAIFFIFYGVTLSLQFFGQHGYLPAFLAAWLPNLAFLAIGLNLYRRLT